MALGDLLTADMQIEVNGLLHDGSGAAATYELMTWPKFFQKVPKVSDLELLGDGDYLGVPYSRAFNLVWDVDIVHATPATLQSNLLALLATWDGTDTQVAFQAGGTKYYLDGQTRRYSVDDDERARSAFVTVTLEFRANPGVTVIS